MRLMAIRTLPIVMLNFFFNIAAIMSRPPVDVPFLKAKPAPIPFKSPPKIQARMGSLVR